MFFFSSSSKKLNQRVAEIKKETVVASLSVAEVARETLCISDRSISSRIEDLEQRRDAIIEELTELRPIKQALVQAIAMAGEAKMETALKELEETLQQDD